MLKFWNYLKKYGVCPECGNELLGNRQGTLLIKDETFYRSCKCGFSIKLDSNMKEVK